MPRHVSSATDETAPRTTSTGSYLLAIDVCDPLSAVTIIDPADGHPIERRAGGIEFAAIETHDGISRLVMADGKQIEQYPGIHAGFSFVEGHGAYGRCQIEGLLVAFKTRPEDQGFVYSLKRLP